MPITFKVSDKTPNVVNFDVQSPEKHYLESDVFPEYQKNGCTEVIGQSQTPSSFLPNSNGFVNAVFLAYNQHHNLAIRPDDVWLAITTQFGLFVNGHAEEMRSMFVSHEGKKQLTVTINGTLRCAPYGEMATLFTNEMKHHIKDTEVCQWALPAFSTTTHQDQIVGSVILMATMKEYFSFKCCLMCGIPNITLLGTTADWEEIHRRVDKLASYGEDCKNWLSLLKIVTGQFVQASRGNIDSDFWNSICHKISGGSGPSYLSGWITAFTFFNKDGKVNQSPKRMHIQFSSQSDTDIAPQPKLWNPANLVFPEVDTDEISPGFLTVDVTVVELGVEYSTIMFAGHTGFEGFDDKVTLAPHSSWALALKGTPPAED